MDIHVHIGNGGVPWWKKCGWPNPTIKAAHRHIKRSNVDEIWIIADTPLKVASFKKNAPRSCKVKSFFWIHDVCNPDALRIERLVKADLVHGIKLHSQVDDFEMTPRVLAKVTAIARRFRLPIIFHTACDHKDDGHKPYDEIKDMHLTAPHKYEELIAKNTDIPFVIGHGGAYALTRLGPPQNPEQNCPGKHYWREDKKPYSLRFLIEEALRISRDYPNAFYDTSVSTNPGKAQLIADFVNANPATAGKILVGTDHPIQLATCPAQVTSLIKKGLHDDLALQIVRNRFSKILADWQW